jgi:hypothetical protein
MDPNKFIQNQLDNDIDEYDIFTSIYKNYLKYNYVTREQCKNSLLLIFDIYFSKPINIDIINEMLKKTNDRLYRGEQQKFRNDLINKFGKCIITGNNEIECEAAHIIDLDDEKLNYNINNGILLTGTLHTLFDKLVWCINPDTFNIEVNYKYNNIEILINNFKHLNFKHLFDEQMTFNLKKKYNKFLFHN